MRRDKTLITFTALFFGSCVIAQNTEIKEKEIQGVVLQGRKPFIEQSANKISLNVAQSPIASTSNAYDILLQSPGVVEQNGILTFRSKTVTVLIDGKLSNLSGEELKSMLSSMQGVTIDKVEILPNPSSKYDAAGGSVINIKLLRNKKSGVNGSVNANTQIGKYASFLPGMTINYKNKSVNIYSSYNYENSNQYFNSNSNQILTSSSNLIQKENGEISKEIHNYRLGVDYEINKRNTVGFLLKGMNNESKLLGYNSINLSNTGTSNLSELNNRINSRIFNPAANIYYKAVLDSLQRTVTANLDYFEYGKKNIENFQTHYISNNFQDNFLRDFADGSNKVYSATIDVEFPTTTGKFEFGLKSTNTKSENSILWENLVNDSWINDTTKSNHFIYKENINAGYVSYDRAIGDNWQMTLGLRGEQTNSNGDLIGGEKNSRNYFNLFPNVSLQYLKNLNNVFNLSYRKSIQRFGFDVVNPFIKYQSEYAYFKGNPNIRPQINHSIDFSYTYRQTLSLGASETHSLDPLGPLYTKSGSTTISTYTNFKSSDFFYIYASWNKEFFKKWTVNLVGGTGFYRFDTSTDNYESVNRNNSWAYLIQNNNSFKFKNNWTAQLNMVYQSPLAMGIYKMKGYFNSNFGISKQLLDNKMTLKLTVSDIFNTMKMRYSVDYNNVILEQSRKKESRFVTVGLTYKFGGGTAKAKQTNQTFEDLEKRMKTEQQ